MIPTKVNMLATSGVCAAVCGVANANGSVVRPSGGRGPPNPPTVPVCECRAGWTPGPGRSVMPPAGVSLVLAGLFVAGAAYAEWVAWPHRGRRDVGGRLERFILHAAALLQLGMAVVFVVTV